MLTTSHYSQSNGNYVLKPGRQLTVSTCLAIAQYCLHRVSDGWLMQNTYLFNSLNRSVTLQNAHVVCTRLTTIINHNHVKLFSLSASYSVSQYSVKKKCLRETHYPWLHYTVHSMCRHRNKHTMTNGLMTKGNVSLWGISFWRSIDSLNSLQTSWIAWHGCDTYTQLNVWWSRLKFNYQLSYFKAKSCRYCKCHLVHKVSTLGGLRQYWTPFGTTGTIKKHFRWLKDVVKPSTHCRCIHSTFICLLIYPWQAWVHSWLTSWPLCPVDIILGKRDLHVQIWFLVDGDDLRSLIPAPSPWEESGELA